MLERVLDTSPSLKLGPSEPRLEIEEEVETDSPTHSLIQPKEEGFLPEEGVIEVSHSTKQPALLMFGSIKMHHPEEVART